MSRQHPVIPSRRSRRAFPARLRARRGFTLVELIVTILILTIGLLGLAGTAAVVAKQMGSGSKSGRGAVIAQARLDSLASISCTALGTGGGSGTYSSPNGSITERWSYADGNDVKNVVDTVRIAGHPYPFIYKSVIPCRD